MKRVAIGVRMHSGWGALVGVSVDNGRVEVVERRRIALIADGVAGAMQPYHFAAKMELADAQKHLKKCFADSERLALAAVREVVEELRGLRYRVAGAALLLASGRILPPLEKILAAHPLIHTAEGEFFRDVFSRACEGLGLRITRIRERDLGDRLQAAFGKTAVRMRLQVSNAGRSLGPPWTADQKTAALAALLVLKGQRS